MITLQPEIMTDEEIDSLVVGIISKFNDDENGFYYATQMYNSVFFRDFPPALRKRACLALRDHFTVGTNNYWDEQAENQFI